jgi:ssDNA-binding Zn-finger/Zn-ribbon topoisomerase 1
MVRCPVCKGEENDLVFSEDQEYRGKHFLYGIYYCPRCGVKFSFSTPKEVEKRPTKEAAAEEEAPQEAS